MKAPLHTQLFRYPFVTSDGVKLSVLDAKAVTKSRTLIVLVPGWTMPASLWRAQLLGLGTRFTMQALDPRGQGKSEVPAGGYNIDRRADDIAEFAARFKTEVVLVGWSLAALEVLQCVHRHGEKLVKAVVLVDSAVGQLPGLPENDTFRAALRDDRARAVAEFCRSMFARPRPEAEIEQLTRDATRMPLEESLALFPSHLPREHWRAIVEGFSKPLLYVVTPRLREQAQSLKKARPATRIEVFEGAGHALFVDEPERFNALLTDFIERNPGMKRLAGLLAALALCGSAAQAADLAPLCARLEKTRYVVEGASSPRSVLYVFFDANCYYCKLTWKALQPYEKVGLQVRWIPVAYQQDSSAGMAAAILQSRSPAAALRVNETRYSAKSYDGGIKPLARVDPEVAAALGEHMKLMQQLGAQGTPAVVWKDAQGAIGFRNAVPRLSELPKITGLPPQKNADPELKEFR